MSRRTRGCAAGALAACVLLSLPALAAPSTLGSDGLNMGPHGDPTGLVLALVVMSTLSVFAFFSETQYAADIPMVVALALCASVAFAALIGALIPLACRLNNPFPLMVTLASKASEPC